MPPKSASLSTGAASGKPSHFGVTSKTQGHDMTPSEPVVNSLPASYDPLWCPSRDEVSVVGVEASRAFRSGLCLVVQRSDEDPVMRRMAHRLPDGSVVGRLDLGAVRDGPVAGVHKAIDFLLSDAIAVVTDPPDDRDAAVPPNRMAPAKWRWRLPQPEVL
eukprot:TRINITY_DN4452_c0_g1_i1.p1 TRINITY_DN4452_c0_g1~~TRINITY_DN4452_c0_g1_i1.p1  ORF type:complete len:160 (-),score=3.36 TRINITY_DN4452_c0_g1_i1:214-693(-)